MTEEIKFERPEDPGALEKRAKGQLVGKLGEGYYESWEDQDDKEKQWERRRKKADEIIDTLGRGVDEKIKDTIVALWSNGFPTSSSCEGHLDHGLGAPWIEVEAENKPEERYVGEKKITEEIAKKYGITCEDVKRANNKEAWVETIKIVSENEETPEYKAWRKENEKLQEKAREILKEFYKDRKVPANIKLKVEKIGGGGAFRIHNGGKDYETMVSNMKEEQKKSHKENLPLYQKEMDDFAKFLKDKFVQ